MAVLYMPACSSHASYVKSEAPYRPAKSGSEAFAVRYCAVEVPLHTTAVAPLMIVFVGTVAAAPVATKSPFANDTAPGVIRLSHVPVPAE